ncbi:MAG: hypothetical protein WD872_05635 [Pirellulaceae bacterium]
MHSARQPDRILVCLLIAVLAVHAALQPPTVRSAAPSGQRESEHEQVRFEETWKGSACGEWRPAPSSRAGKLDRCNSRQATHRRLMKTRRVDFRIVTSLQYDRTLSQRNGTGGPLRC